MNLKVNISDIISEMCKKAEISQAVVAGIIDKAQARVSIKFRDNAFTTDETFKIAEALNCKFALKCADAKREISIFSNDELYYFLHQIDGLQEKMGMSVTTFDRKMMSENFKFIDVIRGLSVDYDVTVETDMSDMTDRDVLYEKYYKSGLSENARLKKNERQREYAKQTNYASNIKYNKTGVKRYRIDCYYSTEADIIEKMESVDNKTGYIKGLIREDIKNNKNL